MTESTNILAERKFPVVTELDESQLPSGISGIEAVATGLPVLIADNWCEIQNPLRRSHLPEEFVSKLKFDKEFVRVKQVPDAPMEDRQAIGSREKECPFCSDTGFTYIPCRGKTSEIYFYYRADCRCSMYRAFFNVWNNDKTVPPRYKKFHLATIKPHQALVKRGYSIASQERDLTDLKHNPYRSVFFTGPTGTGKTSMSVALFNHHLQRSCELAWLKGTATQSVWRIDTFDLVKQLVAWENRPKHDNGNGIMIDDEVKVPVLNLPAINSAHEQGFKVIVFFEEFDKWKDSAFKTEELCRLISRIQEIYGLIYISSNRDLEGVSKFLDGGGTSSGDAIMRRITDPVEAGHTIVTQDSKPGK